MYQQQTEAQLFTTTGIQSHYKMGANAKSLSKPRAMCMFIEMQFSLGVYMNARYKDTR